MPGTEYQFLVCELEYTVLKTSGYRLVSPTQIEGIDIITGAEISDKIGSTQAVPPCSAYSFERCTGWFCVGNCCQVLSDDGTVLDDCDCPDGVLSGCVWMTYYGRTNISCARTCRRAGLFQTRCDCS